MTNQSPKGNLLKASAIIALGLALGAGGIYVGDTDDAPGAALLGLLLMIGLVTFGVKIARRKAPSA
jgi:tetrahydromethanopterin S-methyltransferase subunit C